MSMYRSFKSVRLCLMWIDIFCISRWESQWNGKLLYRFSEELQIDQSSSVGTPGHGLTSALHRTSCVTDGQSLSCISKVLKILAKLQHYLISGHSSRH